MIQNVNIVEIFPRFILEDKNGLAMCRALAAGLRYFLRHAQEGLDITQDVSMMPEWRLDEMAWELDILYDYTADVEIKREWVRNAYRNYRIHGTAEGVRQYLAIYFGESSVNEYWEFSGEPGQFNVTVTGVRTTENENWVRKACAKAKNVRSELNNIVFNGGTCTYAVQGACADVGIAVVEDCVMY